MKTITLNQLKEKSVKLTQIDNFFEELENVTRFLIEEDAWDDDDENDFDLGWFFYNFSTENQRNEYLSKRNFLCDEYLSKQKPFYDEYYSKVNLLYSEYYSKVNLLYSEYQSKKKLLYDEYLSKAKPLYDEYQSKKNQLMFDILSEEGL